MIKESPVSVECRVKEIRELGTHHMFIGEVLSIDADEKYIDEKKNKKLKIFYVVGNIELKLYIFLVISNVVVCKHTHYSLSLVNIVFRANFSLRKNNAKHFLFL